MNSKNKLFQLVLLLFLLVGLVACSVGDEDTTADSEDGDPASSEPAENIDTPSTEAVTLTFAVSGWERGLYESHLESFQEEHPNITIEFISIDEIFGDSHREPVQDGEEPPNNTLTLAKRADVMSFYLYQPDVPDGVLLDLAPFMESDSTMSADDFYPGMLDQFSWDGGVWGIPTQASYGLIF